MARDVRGRLERLRLVYAGPCVCERDLTRYVAFADRPARPACERCGRVAPAELIQEVAISYELMFPEEAGGAVRR